MRLNPDCIRDVLLLIEENIEYYPYPSESHGSFHFYEYRDQLPEYTDEELIYTIHKLVEAGFLQTTDFSNNFYRMCDATLYSLTWEGHQFVETIRSNDVWRRTKTVASKISTFSIEALTNISSTLIADLITKTISG